MSIGIIDINQYYLMTILQAGSGCSLRCAVFSFILQSTCVAPASVTPSSACLRAVRMVVGMLTGQNSRFRWGGLDSLFFFRASY